MKLTPIQKPEYYGPRSDDPFRYAWRLDWPEYAWSYDIWHCDLLATLIP